MFKHSTRLFAALNTIFWGTMVTVAIGNNAWANESNNLENSWIVPVSQNPESPRVLKPAIANFQAQASPEKKPAEVKESNNFSPNTKLQGQLILTKIPSLG